MTPSEEEMLRLLKDYIDARVQVNEATVSAVAERVDRLSRIVEKLDDEQETALPREYYDERHNLLVGQVTVLKRDMALIRQEAMDRSYHATRLLAFAAVAVAATGAAVDLVFRLAGIG